MQKEGRIVKGIAGFYYVTTQEGVTYECKAKGIFRKDQISPMPGDYVTIEIDMESQKGSISAIHERKNALIRPPVANVDQVLLVCALTHPEPNVGLLDRYLLDMSRQGVPVCLCFNKVDGASSELRARYATIYQKSGYLMMWVSALEGTGVSQLQEYLRGKTTVMAGVSGVGKSTLMNCLAKAVMMETGDLSHKTERGRHTTRHSQVWMWEDGTCLIDTPGFSSYEVQELLPEEVKEYYREFEDYAVDCRFQGCVHIHEPGCAVCQAVQAGYISTFRYEGYKEIYIKKYEQHKRIYTKSDKRRN